MASHFNVTAEKLADDVLKGSLAEQLLKLAEFYQSRDQDADAVFAPLLEQAAKSNEEAKPSSSIINSNENKNKSKGNAPEKWVTITISPKRTKKTGKLIQRKTINHKERRTNTAIEASG